MIPTVSPTRASYVCEGVGVGFEEDPLIKPDRMGFDGRASSLTQGQEILMFRAKVVVPFIYDAFDGEVLTTINGFSGTGGEMTFDLDFVAIP